MQRAGSIVSRLAAAGTAAALAVAIGGAVLTLPREADGLSRHVQQRLGDSGVSHPVTAVLMNFRGYDTLLEMAVLALAVLGARALAAGGRRAPPPALESPVLDGLLRLVAPLMVIVTGYLLWVGGHAPGGAFQAGALLAALGVLLLLGGRQWPRGLSERGERLLAVGGLAVFVLVGVGVLSPQRSLLEYPRGISKWLILLIEAACTISIAAVLTALFAGGKLVEDGDHSR
jgi:multisubunit Na+/H+ antiporter MnhB subunit